MGFSTLDMVIVMVYMTVSAGVGAWIGRHQKDTTDYFLGGRQIPWFAVTFSIVATETSVLTFISLPAVSYQGDMTFLQIVVGCRFKGGVGFKRSKTFCATNKFRCLLCFV